MLCDKCLNRNTCQDHSTGGGRHLKSCPEFECDLTTVELADIARFRKPKAARPDAPAAAKE